MGFAVPRRIAACCILVLAPVAAAAPLGTAFTYQGQLKEDGVPFDGSANMVFKLFDAAAAGNLLGTQTVNGVPLANGLFTVELNAGGQFGANAFNGDERWLEVSVNGTPLVPRQPLTATPYALQSRGIFADDAGNVGMGTRTPHHRLRLSGGPGWTSNFWSGAMELDNAAAIGWQPNAAGSRFGIGQSTGGLYFFHSASDPGATGSPAIYDMTIADSGNVGFGTATPAFPVTIQKPGYGWVHTDGTHYVGSWVDGMGGWLGTRSVDPLHLFTANAALPQATLTTAGNFGVGTTSPSAKLHARSANQTAAVRAEGSGSGGTAIEIGPGAIRVPGAGANTATPVFVHVASSGSSRFCDLSGCYCYETVIDHPMTNNDPNAILFVILNGSAGQQPQIDRVYYDGGVNKWVIDCAQSFCHGQKFNVLVFKP